MWWHIVFLMFNIPIDNESRNPLKNVNRCILDLERKGLEACFGNVTFWSDGEENPDARPVFVRKKKS